MSFSEQYAALECKFKEQVKKDNKDFGIDSCFLANVAPKAQVDYVLVAMEPSRPANIANIKNFAVSVEDFIVHLCASEYLCKGEGEGERERTYHITDLSKGAMRVSDASSSPALRYERYKRWYPLLCEEIKLVARPNAPIIPVGYVVRDFLCVQKMSDLKNEILHYSQSAARHRPKKAECHPEQFAAFEKTVKMKHIKDTVKRVMEGADLGPGEPEKTLDRLHRGKGLTKSRKQLMFTYKCQFEKLLGAAAESS